MKEPITPPGQTDDTLAMRLAAWYAGHGRKLPWRETRDPYRIWISEIILQQTRIAQGTDYYLRFIERFPDVRSLAQAPQDTVMKYWQGLGYYSRARHLHAAAQTIVERFGGDFPRVYSQVRALPGVGDYTAAAICSIAYDMPRAVVDGNVYRVLSRYFDIDTPIDTAAGKRLFARTADEQLDREHPGRYNEALMDFGALQCVPGQPDCPCCPLQDRCRARACDTVGLRPVKSKRTRLKDRYLHYFYTLCPQGVAVRCRKENDIWRGLYEFPMIETAEDIPWERLSHSADFIRLIGRETEAEIPETEPKRVRHVLSHQCLHIRFYRLRIPGMLSGYECCDRERLSLLAFPRPLAAYLEGVEK